MKFNRSRTLCRSLGAHPRLPRRRASPPSLPGRPVLLDHFWCAVGEQSAEQMHGGFCHRQNLISNMARMVHEFLDQHVRVAKGRFWPPRLRARQSLGGNRPPPRPDASPLPPPPPGLESIPDNRILPASTAADRRTVAAVIARAPQGHTASTIKRLGCILENPIARNRNRRRPDEPSPPPNRNRQNSGSR